MPGFYGLLVFALVLSDGTITARNKSNWCAIDTAAPNTPICCQMMRIRNAGREANRRTLSRDRLDAHLSDWHAVDAISRYYRDHFAPRNDTSDNFPQIDSMRFCEGVPPSVDRIGRI
jgi:hypothetical protein